MDELPPGDDRRETPTERLDRNWEELLQELRVTQTGVQILAGFLLTIPFQQRFTDLTSDQRTAYLVALTAAVVATTLIVAPVSAHRLLFRRRAKQQLVTFGDIAARSGLVSLTVSIVSVTFLIFDIVIGRGAAVTASLLTLALFVVNWLVLPLILRSRLPEPDKGGLARE